METGKKIMLSNYCTSSLICDARSDQMRMGILERRMETATPQTLVMPKMGSASLGESLKLKSL